MDDRFGSELRKAKAQKTRNNTDWKPIDLVEQLLDDMRSGETKCNKMLVIYWDDEEADGMINTGQYRANITRAEEIAMVRFHEHKTLHLWLGDDL